MARKVKVNMTGVESFARATEGEHIAKLISIEEAVSQAGNDKLAAKFEITKGESLGARVYEDFPLTEKALWKLKGLLEAIGLNSDGKLILDLDKMEGRTCIISVKYEDYNGQTRAKIQEFKKMGSKPPVEDEDEDEEEDDEEEEVKPKKPSKPAPAAKPSKPKKPAPKPEPEDDDDDDDEWED